jgi:hypothetical protein
MEHLDILEEFKYDIVWRKFTEDGFNYFVDMRYDFMQYYHRMGPVPLPLLEDYIEQLIELHHQAMAMTVKLIFNPKDETL